MTTVAGFGTWASPLSPATAAAARRSRSGLASDGRSLYWLESRPSEGGRTVLVCGEAEPGAAVRDVSPSGASIRSRVHEYGGGAYCLVPGAGGPPALAYVDQSDQRVWLAGLDRGGATPGAGPRALSGEPPPGVSWAHGDLRATPDGRWVLAVREAQGDGAVARAVVAYATGAGAGAEAGAGAGTGAGTEAGAGAGDPAGDAGAGAPGGGTVLCSGRGFYAAPRPDPSGRHLAWICWDHPDMPWDASELRVAPLSLGRASRDGGSPVGNAVLVAGGRSPGSGGGESVGQPLWCADGSLVYVSDAAGWWQPYRWRPSGGPGERLCGEAAEFHGPDWALGQATVAELPDGTLACRRRHGGADAVVLLRAGGGSPEPLDQPCVSIAALCAHRGGVAWLGATPRAAAAPWWWPGPAAGGAASAGDGVGAARACGPAEAPLLDTADVSVARHLVVPGGPGGPGVRHGPGGPGGSGGPGGPVAPDDQVHVLYYPPTLGGTRGPPGSAPPLVVACHGGPTGNAEAGLDPVVQLLTTRGFAVAAVDYAGSTGYGRAYRQRLEGAWGVADVDDCVAAARRLAEQGLADPARMAIRGSSAGGLTALNALVRSDAFAAAVSWYGVTDLLSLAAATHDFEAHYTDRLVGPLPGTEEEYRRRSPVERVADMTGAVLVLQGLDDPVVPPALAEAMVAALRRRGLACRYLAFPGESHGFRRAETLEAAFAAELDFYDSLLVSR